MKQEQKEIHNAIIRASAGSGKTFELVKRYLRLLALGEAPEGIAAMTFTRKAAREFFERILQKLAELAEHPEKARGYVDELAEDGKSLALLRRVIGSMDRLRLGTIDSFFASVARCFPFELGLSGAASIMAEDETTRARDEVMNGLLVELTRDGDEVALREMLEAWKRATAGDELNMPSKHLAGWFRALHPLYLEKQDESVWGGVSTIWPGRDCPVWMAHRDLGETIARLKDVLDMTAFVKKAETKWEVFFDAITKRRVGEPIKTSSPFEYMLKPERGEYELLREGRAEWRMESRKGVPLDRTTGSALADLLDVLVGREMLCRAERTQGRRALVAKFDAHYAKNVRGRGRLAFDDLTWLLSGQVKVKGLDEDEVERLEMMRREWEYRLDSRFQHWLFDEFQDTSRRQWEVVANLVDEAATDPEGRRSFFAVGDLKQSLYLFRQAEPELFLDVESRYAKARMEKRAPLATSYRSSPVVLGMVNEVFGKVDLLREMYPDAMRWWSYERHEASSKTRSLSGYATMLSVPEESELDGEEARDELTAAIIREVEPLERGLSCVVLTRTNKEAERVSEALRRILQVEVVCESQVFAAVDNPVTLALLSVFQLAVHPGDSYSREHLRMSPLGAWFDEQGDVSKAVGTLGGMVRRGVSQDGFLLVAQEWAERLRGEGEWDAFSAMRLGQFFDLAAEFDEGGRRDIDEFIEAARGFAISAVDQGRALQVMTFHKAKGLEFDVVIMPQLLSKPLDQPMRQNDTESLLVERDEQGELVWLLDDPQKILRERDKRLKAAHEKEKARLAYQGLCRLYVGMTRAKRGLYVILPDGGNARSEADLLKQTLGGAEIAKTVYDECEADCWYEDGKRGWFEEMGKKARSVEVETAEEGPKLGDLLKVANRPSARKTPSGEESFRMRGEDLLSPHRETARRMGSLVHDLFSAVEWLNQWPLNHREVEACWEAEGWQGREGYDEARERVWRVLQQPEIRAWFVDPQGNREVWRERSFDLFNADGWISGVFDRVVMERDAAGRVISASVLDFKTDLVADEAGMKDKAKGYEPQLRLYAQAVARLTGLPVERVKTGLIFVATARLVWV
jgi:ATP-dependent helicase/nuclease subunit A